MKRRNLLLATGGLALLVTSCGGTTATTTPQQAAPASSTTAGTPAPPQRCDLEINIAGYYDQVEEIGVVEHQTMTIGGGGGGGGGSTTTMDPNMDHSKMDHAKMDQSNDGHAHGGSTAVGPREGAPDDTGHGGVEGPQPWKPMTDKAECDKLRGELTKAKEVAMRYRTIADAKAAGYALVAPYVPGIASHMMNFSLVDGTFDLEKPEMILYDGNADDSTVVGLSYYVYQPGENEPSQGFTGPNDHYHRHLGLCIKDARVIGPERMSKEACEAAGGAKSDGGAGWMNHTWIVPGCESPWGMFSAENPRLDWALVAASTQPGNEGCAGSNKKYDGTPGPRPDQKVG